MKTKIITSILMMMPLLAEAQVLDVLSFEPSPLEIIGSGEQRKDFNGDFCALIKVQVFDDIDHVEGNIIGNIINKGVEKWIYMTRGTKFFRIYLKNYLPITLSCSDYHIDGLESKRVYVLRLSDSKAGKQQIVIAANQDTKEAVKSPINTEPTKTSETEIETVKQEKKQEIPQARVADTTEDILFTLNNQKFNLDFKMIYVEGGTFSMGCNNQQEISSTDEFPAHSVTLDSYYIGETEVTQELWEAITNKNPSLFVKFGSKDWPVEQVSWNDCQYFINVLNITLADQLPKGKMFRLPTEAEWEFAARGGTKSKGYKYAGSNNANEVAWYYDNSGKSDFPVASKVPNELGLYDMSGNVAEWCEDVFGSYDSNPQVNPKGPDPINNKAERVYRGGGWSRPIDESRVSARSSSSPNNRFRLIGLRLAL